MHVQRDSEVSARSADSNQMRVTTAATIQNLKEQEEDSDSEIEQANLRADAHSVEVVPRK